MIRGILVEAIGTFGEGESTVGSVKKDGGGDGGVHGDTAMTANVGEGKDVANGGGVEPGGKGETWEAGENAGLDGGERATLGGEDEGGGSRGDIGKKGRGTDDAVGGEVVQVQIVGRAKGEWPRPWSKLGVRWRQRRKEGLGEQRGYRPGETRRGWKG